jgi:haloalkane dehalogenase
MTHKGISEQSNIPSKTVKVLGSNIHYQELGTGNPILFLHGIPASSYLWRNVIPYLSDLGRCIAPDLIGCGKSDKPDISYSISDHIKYIEAFIEALNLKDITIVMHGWGSIIGSHYATHHQANCKGLVFYESFLTTPDNDESSLPYEELVSTLRQQIQKNEMADGAGIVDVLFQHLAIRKLSKAELEHYHQPFTKQADIKPILQYINELPTQNSDTATSKLIANYTKALTRSTIPKLMLYSVPGFITTISTVMWAKENIPNLEVVDVGEELHFGQESDPNLIGETISVWLQSAEQTL